VYTTLTLSDLEKSKSNLDNALKVRNDAYQKELARQRANDALCKQFAGVADPFVKWIVEQKDQITQSKAELDEQLKFVNAHIASISKDGAKLGPIKELNAKMEAAGITNNRYTTLTSKDVEVQWEQYQSFLKKKQKMLEEEIEHHKMRGVTAEQFKEIEENFRLFDKDQSGNIDKKELKACLYSLGEEKNRSEIEGILKQYGKDGRMPYPSFKEFMISLLGVSVTKDDILNSFNLICKGEEVAKLERMEVVMAEEDIDYIKKTAPAAKGGYNYVPWTEDVFSR
jgi:Ca2+-binding EF-hand superfamily protein